MLREGRVKRRKEGKTQESPKRSWKLCEVLSTYLTCDGIGGDRAMALSPGDAVEVELISTGGR